MADPSSLASSSRQASCQPVRRNIEPWCGLAQAFRFLDCPGSSRWSPEGAALSRRPFGFHPVEPYDGEDSKLGNGLGITGFGRVLARADLAFNLDVRTLREGGGKVMELAPKRCSDARSSRTGIRRIRDPSSCAWWRATAR